MGIKEDMHYIPAQENETVVTALEQEDLVQAYAPMRGLGLGIFLFVHNLAANQLSFPT